ncbi:MAG: M14 family metallopeptidase, partial [Polyangiales bacterium]
EALARGFRERFLNHVEITAQLRAWATAFPELARVETIGTTPEGRAIDVLVIGRDPERVRPAAWIDGNMHATELCGSNVALGVAEDVLRVHLTPDSELYGMAPHVRDRLRETLFYVLPRMSPDGAEVVLEHGRYVRSAPRDGRTNTLRPYWSISDIDGDGLCLCIRVKDDSGEYVESIDVPGMMLPRRLEDPGPYFKIYPEGLIENWDGSSIPNPHYLADNEIDLNRQFPYMWGPEHEQIGAGDSAGSAPEARAVIEYASRRPNIFAWLNLHTFGGVFIRPLGSESDKKMDETDLALFRQIGAWNEELTGYPTVSGFEDFLYQPDKPLRGDLTEWAYHQRGAIAYVAELWDIFAQIGVERRKPFVDTYNYLSRDDMVRLGKWDAEVNKGRAIRPWKAAKHPQLGDVEVGGVDMRVGLSNPPLEYIDTVCRQHSAAFLRVAALAPHTAIAGVKLTALGSGVDQVRRVDVRVKNLGYLPTTFIESARKLSINEPLELHATAHGCAIVDGVDATHARRTVGHLEGWGRGLFSGSGTILWPTGKGNGSEKTVAFVVRGRGTVTVRAGSSRVGWVEKTIEVG